MNRGYVTPGEAGLIVFIVGIVLGTALITTADYYTKDADDQYIDRKSDMCVIRVTAPCGNDDICRYKTSVPCAELDVLVKASKGGK